jgi:L-seryl-tRNA(Ser) seleniumtransferase
MPPEVLEAMAEASRNFVDLPELNRAAGKVIARITGAEAGLVTAGSADSILLATAALMTGTDPAKIGRLPDTTGMKNEIIVHRSQRHAYDHMITVAGAKLVEVGLAYRTQPWELEAAINEKTAGVFYTVSPVLRGGFLPLPEVIHIAHAHTVPVYIDAASMLPPASNLQKFVSMGADMVILSGGKGVMGPQSTGILCGRADLIEAAALSGSPYHALGRAAKVCREEIVGLVVALEMYVRRDHAADWRRWQAQAGLVADAVKALGLPGVHASVHEDPDTEYCPEAYIAINEKEFGASADEVRSRIENGEPRIATGMPVPRTVVIDPHMLQEGEAEIVARRLTQVLTELRVAQPVPR